jgi:hypothetical protein
MLLPAPFSRLKKIEVLIIEVLRLYNLHGKLFKKKFYKNKASGE